MRRCQTARPPRRQPVEPSRARCSIARTVSSRIPAREASSCIFLGPGVRQRVPVVSTHRAQRIQDVHVEPHVGVRQPVASCPSVEQVGQRPVGARPLASATRASPRARSPSQQGSPIWQARANDCSRQAAAPAESPRARQHLPEQRLRPRRKDSQCSRLGKPAHGRQVPGRCVEVTPGGPPGPASTVRSLATGFPHRPGARGSPPPAGRPPAGIGPVAGHRAQVGQRLRPGGRRPPLPPAGPGRASRSERSQRARRKST